MEPFEEYGVATPTQHQPILRADTGMVVLDSAGEEAGTVSAVQLPGTDVRPDAVAGIAELLMGSGYLRIDGTGALSNDTYASGEQIAEIVDGDPGVVHLRGRRAELHRATS